MYFTFSMFILIILTNVLTRNKLLYFCQKSNNSSRLAERAEFRRNNHVIPPAPLPSGNLKHIIQRTIETRRGSPVDCTPFSMQLHHYAKSNQLRFTILHCRNFLTIIGFIIQMWDVLMAHKMLTKKTIVYLKPLGMRMLKNIFRKIMG